MKEGRTVVACCFVGVLLFHAVWGISQFILQHDLGLTTLGESIITPHLPAVAKFSWGESKVLRAYGPYEHANTFGGAMLVGLVFLTFLAYYKPLVQEKRFFLLTWLLFLLGLGFSFSRMAYVGVIILVFLSVFFFRVRLRKVSLGSLIILVGLSPFLLARFTDVGDAAVSDRAQGYEWWVGVMQGLPLGRGTGLGEYQTALRYYLTQQGIFPEIWEIAPVHSVPLFLLAEWGIWPTLFLVSFLICWAMWHFSVKRQALQLLWLLPFLPAILFDHYFLTQTAPLLLILGLAVYLMVMPAPKKERSSLSDEPDFHTKLPGQSPQSQLSE